MSLQIEKRQSEDFDFMVWQKHKNEKVEVNWPSVKKELDSVGQVRGYEVGGMNYVSFNFEGVKLSFYAAPRKAIKTMHRINFVNNLFISDIESIGAMKMETMLRRSKFRDYYDIFSILKEGVDIQKMINLALEHSEHKLRTRGLLAMLTNGSRFIKEKGFEELLPVYDVTPYDIQEYIKQKLLEAK